MVAALGNVRNKGRIALLMLIAMGATMARLRAFEKSRVEFRAAVSSPAPR